MSNVTKNTTAAAEATNNAATAKATKVANTVKAAKQAIAAPQPTTAKEGSIKYRLLSEIASASAAVKALVKNEAMFAELDELATALQTVARLNGKEYNELPLLGLHLVASGNLSEGKYIKYLSLFGASTLNGANLVDRFQAATKKTNKALVSQLERKTKSDDKDTANSATKDMQALSDLQSDFQAALAAWQAVQK